MSLTLLLHEKRRVIGIAEWFKDALQNLSFEKGPIREIPSDNFRNVGYNVVLSHFEVYVRIRITEEQRAPFFANARDEQTYLKRCKPLHISLNASTSQLYLNPMHFVRYRMEYLRPVASDFVIKIPLRPTETEFWNAFELCLKEL